MQVRGGGLGLKWLLANHDCQTGMKGLNLRETEICTRNYTVSPGPVLFARKGYIWFRGMARAVVERERERWGETGQGAGKLTSNFAPNQSRSRLQV